MPDQAAPVLDAPAIPDSLNSLPGETDAGNHVATHIELDPEVGGAARGAELDRMFRREPAVAPVEKKPAPAPEPVVEKKPDVIPPVLPVEKKPEEKPAGEKPAVVPVEGDELPDDLLEGLPEKQPENYKEANRYAATMRRRLAKADDAIKKNKKELEALRAATAGTPPPDYEEVKTRAARIEQEHQETQKQLKEAQDRLYVQDLRSRPEYQEQVAKPWASVQETVGLICAKYANNPQGVDVSAEGVWRACKMAKATERDAVLDEIMSVMTPRDQHTFNAAIETIPKINDAKALLEANSKEKLEAFRERDKTAQERQRSATIDRALAAQNNVRDARHAAFPFLYKVEGDTPEAKAYNEGIAKIEERAQQIVRGGTDKLPPEFQASMVLDALVTDFILNNVGHVFKTSQARIAELEKAHADLETAYKTMESELREYKGGVPSSEGNAPGHLPKVAEDAPLSTRLSQLGKRIGWPDA
jgi:hypothetical protein